MDRVRLSTPQKCFSPRQNAYGRTTTEQPRLIYQWRYRSQCKCRERRRFEETWALEPRPLLKYARRLYGNHFADHPDTFACRRAAVMAVQLRLGTIRVAALDWGF